MTPGRYVPLNSPLHHLDPRTKIFAAGLFITTVFITQSPVIQVLLVALLLALARFARLPLRLIWHSLLPVVPVIILTFGLNAWATPGSPVRIFSWETNLLSGEGLVRGGLLTGRLVTVVLVAALLTLTTSPLALSDALSKLLGPLQRINLPIGELVLALVIALRFVPILFDEATRLYRAQIARGADFSGGLIRRIRSFFPLLIPLFVSAFERADRLATALEMRGYRSGAKRSAFQPLSFSARDVCAFMFAGGVLVFGVSYEKLCAAIFA